jgi:hypothetical protein
VASQFSSSQLQDTVAKVLFQELRRPSHVIPWSFVQDCLESRALDQHLVEKRTVHALNRSFKRCTFGVEEKGYPEVVGKILVGMFDREPHKSRFASARFASYP